MLMLVQCVEYHETQREDPNSEQASARRLVLKYISDIHTDSWRRNEINIPRALII